MAAFSAYKQPVTMDGIFGEFMPNFQQLYSAFGNCQENSSFTASAHESSCVEQQSLTSLPKKQRSKSLSMADKAESGEQVAQNCVPAADKKKRKSRNGSSLTSANSKDYAKQIKSKKQKGDIKVEAKNEEKNDKKDQTKSTTEVEPPKDYIHVRARRGQATDSHSLAERVRREKISERMRTLQAIVPGCDKVTGKAFMLDEIINYVQSLQNQVEFLSLKLSSLDPMVYTFGLMDLDPIAFGADVQGMNNSNMGFPIPFSAQSVSGSVSGSDSPPAQVFATANSCLSSPAPSSTLSPTFPNNPHVDCSANLLRHDQKPIFLPTQQDAGSLYWEVNEQERQNIINQFGLFSGNNLYSLH